MKIKQGAAALLVSLALTTLSGCSMTGTDDSDSLPSAGVSTTDEAADMAEAISSELYDLIGLKGKATEPGPGVGECGGKDPEKYFTVFHAWTFTPASADGLDGVMERFKEELPKHGWKIVEYGPDTSKNKNLALTADNDAKKYSVMITHWARQTPPKVRFFLTSGCYQVPEGEKVERF
ncbi:hypothetical protein M5362_25960 [Streptomyces sp. Je 1-79]|uniref:hypothetical protein n=1 Tax=Streptomyces sp. Je 1-79 TaxID=2943847 RepID=UPI0021A8A0D1|nr:hypothetical protein [Streptomyces sp. Je 1-79]MCT4356576.1 hypothetical protein [Streptomyces sp. Je 1-79]